MALPANNKQVGDLGHADDHNSIVNEINALIAASVNYLTVSESSNFLPMAASANYLTISASSNFLPMAASANYLTISASSNFLPMAASANYLPISSSANYLFAGTASVTYLTIGASINFVRSTITTNVQTGTSYTLAVSDNGKIIEMNNAAANLVIIPLNASVALPIGTKLDIIQTGAGATSASTVSGVTLNSESGKRTLNAQWSAASLVKRATDTWIMVGAIKA